MKYLAIWLAWILGCVGILNASGQISESSTATESIKESARDATPFSKASESSTAIEAALKQAASQNLAASKEWRRLLHIENKQSEITSPFFFLNTQKHRAKNLAQAELEATIRAFYQDVDEVQIPPEIIAKREEQIKEYLKHDIKLPTRSIQKEDYHALCRFPARLAFLKAHIELESLPSLPCAEFQAMKDYIAPTRASVIFPSAHINSPASMFGHTFLLLDSKFNSRLLSFAINYQADADQSQENAVAFALKGLFGFYSGSYSILPYYDKIKEYSNTESRDIWEYGLNLTQEEVTRLYNHIWELSDAFSPYYFFHRNCSYNILWLLEVARPSLNLRQKFIYQVNPPETLFAMEEAGLITTATYRPSKRTKLYAYEKRMSFKEVRAAKALAKDRAEFERDIAPHFTHAQQQDILESALELAEYRYIKGKLEHDRYTTLAHSLASSRSALGASEPLSIPTPSHPLEGNRSLRLTPLLLANAHGTHPGLDFRITFHDITDNDRGYLKGAQIEFMRTLGYYDTSRTPQSAFRLHELNILSLASIAPLGKFFKPISYRFETGLNRKFNDKGLHYFAALGVGASVGLGASRELTTSAYGYYLLEPSFFINAHNKADFMLSHVLGLIFESGDFKSSLEYKLKAFSSESVDSEPLSRGFLSHYTHFLNATLSYELGRNLSLFSRLELHNVSESKQDLRLDSESSESRGLKELHLFGRDFAPTAMLGVRMYF